jgi:hypothetical protein
VLLRCHLNSRDGEARSNDEVERRAVFAGRPKLLYPQSSTPRRPRTKTPARPFQRLLDLAPPKLPESPNGPEPPRSPKRQRRKSTLGARAAPLTSCGIARSITSCRISQTCATAGSTEGTLLRLPKGLGPGSRCGPNAPTEVRPVLLRCHLNSRDVEARSNVQVERPPNAAQSAERAHNRSCAREAGTHRSRSAPTKVRWRAPHQLAPKRSA